jgi:surface polysaccharide O-acyltransferase-like enzyme
VPRNAFIDHLRIVLTSLVILHHTAIVYGGGGSWYWRQEADGSNMLLLMFNAVNQSYFMGFFFLLAGYYTPRSFERKGVRRFLADRFLRLGLPLVAYFFILSPMTIALARTSEGHPFWSGWWLMERRRIFEPGPLWFAEALLIFALVYAAWRALRHDRSTEISRIPGSAILALAAVIAGATSFLVRLAVPTGQTILWLQLGYFPPYVLFFIVGCMTARSRLLERVTFADAKGWALVSVFMLALLIVVIATRWGHGSFSGGWNGNAAFYALWDPFTAWGIILFLLWSFRTYWAAGTRLAAGLARRAYGAYIVHPPVLVALSLFAREWSAAPLVKFAAIGLAACMGSFVAASGVLLIPGAKRIV